MEPSKAVIGLDLVNIFFKQNDQEIRGILAKSG
jgi:hypothetical protein